MKILVETNSGDGVLVGVGSPTKMPQAKVIGRTEMNTASCQDAPITPRPVYPSFTFGLQRTRS